MLAYLTIFVIAYLENVIPPIPGDMIVVFGGYMAGLGLLHPGIVILISTVGGSLGFMTMYIIGYKVGYELMDPAKYRWVPKQKIDTVKVQLHAWGFKLVAANRFLSGLRSVISLTVGMSHMSPGQTALWSAVSSLVWTALITGAGFYVGENWEVVGEYLKAYGMVITALIILYALYRVIKHLVIQKKASEQL